MRAGSRSGTPVPISSRCTAPSVRNSATCDETRALAAPLQHAAKLVRQLLDGAEHIVLARDRLGEPRSAMAAGTGRRGVIGSSARPSA